MQKAFSSYYNNLKQRESVVSGTDYGDGIVVRSSTTTIKAKEVLLLSLNEDMNYKDLSRSPKATIFEWQRLICQDLS